VWECELYGFGCGCGCGFRMGMCVCLSESALVCVCICVYVCVCVFVYVCVYVIPSVSAGTYMWRVSEILGICTLILSHVYFCVVLCKMCK